MPELIPLELIHNQPADAVVTVRANLRALQLKRNKLGELWASMVLEQSGSTTTVLVFARTYAAIPAGLLQSGMLLQFDARVLRDSDGRTLLAPITVPAPAP